MIKREPKIFYIGKHFYKSKSEDCPLPAREGLVMKTFRLRNFSVLRISFHLRVPWLEELSGFSLAEEETGPGRTLAR